MQNFLLTPETQTSAATFHAMQTKRWPTYCGAGGASGLCVADARRPAYHQHLCCALGFALLNPDRSYELSASSHDLNELH